MKEIFEEIYSIDDKLCTKNLSPAKRVYGEELVKQNGVEYRLWNPNRSKLAAAIINGLENQPIKKGSSVLYLGAATGTTASHVSDIVGEDGTVFCVEFSQAPMKKLLDVCKTRENMIPLFFNANFPENYAPFLERVDVVYQDIAQRNQTEILIINSKIYLKDRGSALLAIKSRSIDSVKSTESVVSDEIGRLKSNFKVKEVIKLEPFEGGHALVVCEKTTKQQR
jgi:fibrillarin-like pre-rRNA processing protein